MSKGLEDFEELKKTTCFYCQYHINEECVNDKCIWNNVEKELKALEIIKRFSHYDIDFLDYLLVNEGKISQKEYDLLKEVLL